MHNIHIAFLLQKNNLKNDGIFTSRKIKIVFDYVKNIFFLSILFNWSIIFVKLKNNFPFFWEVNFVGCVSCIIFKIRELLNIFEKCFEIRCKNTSVSKWPPYAWNTNATIWKDRQEEKIIMPVENDGVEISRCIPRSIASEKKIAQEQNLRLARV